MAQYTTIEEVQEGRKLHPDFLILKSGDSIEGNMVPTIKFISSNATTASVTISDLDVSNEVLNLVPLTTYFGPFGLSTGHEKNSHKKIECTAGEVYVKFKF